MTSVLGGLFYRGRHDVMRFMILTGIFHIPSNLVVVHGTSDGESNAPLDFLWRHARWTPFGCLISCKIMSIISAACDFTTKSNGICDSRDRPTWGRSDRDGNRD